MKKGAKSTKPNAISKHTANVANFGKKIGENVSNAIGNNKLIKKMPGEFKLVGVIALLVVALYLMQLITTPSFLKSQVDAVSGFVVSDTPKVGVVENRPAQAVQEQPKAVVETKPVEKPKPTVPVTIIGPEKGSTQTSGFILQTEYSQDVVTCYYRVDNAGNLAWDRRMRPCVTELPITYCSSGSECSIYVEVADGNNNIMGKDTATYKIQ